MLDSLFARERIRDRLKCSKRAVVIRAIHYRKARAFSLTALRPMYYRMAEEIERVFSLSLSLSLCPQDGKLLMERAGQLHADLSVFTASLTEDTLLGTEVRRDGDLKTRGSRVSSGHTAGNIGDSGVDAAARRISVHLPRLVANLT